ncbi:MAG: hypothetical protein ACRCYU_23575 [Nocardioides sp.]
MTTSRIPAGTTAGGQFAPTEQREAEVSLPIAGSHWSNTGFAKPPTDVLRPSLNPLLHLPPGLDSLRRALEAEYALAEDRDAVLDRRLPSLSPERRAEYAAAFVRATDAATRAWEVSHPGDLLPDEMVNETTIDDIHGGDPDDAYDTLREAIALDWEDWRSQLAARAVAENYAT